MSLGKTLHCITTRCPITSLAWDPSEWRRRLFVGGADGLLAIMENFKEQEPIDAILTGVKAPVYAIAIDPYTGHIAIALRSEVHIAKELENCRYATFKILPIPPELPSPQKPSKTLDNCVRTHVLTFKNCGRELVATYLNHSIVCWHIKNESSVQRWCISPIHGHQLIGHVALSPDESSVLLSNLSDGLDLYTVGQNHPQQSYKFSHSRKANVPV
ncbi:uncharacterized protein F5891DRAFT_1198419 [Suillus fuscotomentosus]|uniref:Uncharacterized protein n=1 Tax=Suillus fuscotomentosus TaxID=1912939 RepID=A0AAD4DSJ2_9AGAM|nr:uncharacterized protein F5891DRAFT_1198419 [Suillus fuscotomentosus]KAG1889753.1 hypothetical protein F5891DRAFT_1198419 [Suillus fuscotomentosus]